MDVASVLIHVDFVRIASGSCRLEMFCTLLDSRSRKGPYLRGRTMCQVIVTDFCVQWALPVCVTIAEHGLYMVRGPKQAVDLLRAWPRSANETHRKARRACIAAICRREPAALARVEFLDACRDAGMLVRHDLEGLC